MAALLFVAAVAPAAAQDEGQCVEEHVTDDPALTRPGRVVDTAVRSHFYRGSGERKDCPAAGAPCRTQAYVVRGDRIFVAPPRSPGFVCAAFVSPRGVVTAGWLEEWTLEMQPSAPPRLADRVGKWSSLDSTIVIKRGKAAGSLSLDGESFSKRSQTVNTGEFSVENVKPAENALAFAEKDGETVPIAQADKTSCALTMALLRDVLVVNDNGNCGGLGVYFTGFYRRKR